MRLSHVTVLALLSCTTAVSAAAQYQQQAPAGAEEPRVQRPAVQSHITPPVAVGEPLIGREWYPVGIAALGQFATSRTEFTLDHSMLVMASKLDRDNEDLRRVIAGVNGVSVHSFRFPGEVSFDPAAMEQVIQEYRDAGWQHLVSKHKEDGGLTTDVWLRMDGGAIRDIAVLFVGVKQLNFVSVSGSISPLDLLHLSGHFGIPKMDGGVAVQVPRR